jgi:Trk K+ transport system NAD-binding subunit
VQVILLRRRSEGGSHEVRVPSADDEILEGDRLVVAGTKNRVESLDAI